MFQNGESPETILRGFTIAGPRGGIFCANSSPTVDNCIITGHFALNGAGVYNYNGGSPHLIQATIADNFAQAGSGVYVAANSHPFLTNSIVWANTDPGFDVDGSSSADFACCDVQGAALNNDNVSEDPLFAGDRDYRLSPGSPCIHACPVVLFGKSNPADITGRLRNGRDASDRGAYEFGPGDYNCDRLVTLTDFASWSTCVSGPVELTNGADCLSFDDGGDYDVDLHDFAAFQNAISVE
jgi:hypothetical protein